MSPDKPIVLAVDPSIRCAGVAILEGDVIIAHGTIETKLKDEMRYVELQRQIADCIREYKPEVLAIETQYLTGLRSNAVLKTATASGIFIGVFLNLVPKGRVISISPLEGKQALGLPGGTKRDEAKADAVIAIKRLYNLEVSNDEADAVGIGFAAKGKLRFS